jgi:hypothetical protein
MIIMPFNQRTVRSNSTFLFHYVTLVEEGQNKPFAIC